MSEDPAMADLSNPLVVPVAGAYGHGAHRSLLGTSAQAAQQRYGALTESA